MNNLWDQVVVFFPRVLLDPSLQPEPAVAVECHDTMEHRVAAHREGKAQDARDTGAGY